MCAVSFSSDGGSARNYFVGFLTGLFAGVTFSLMAGGVGAVAMMWVGTNAANGMRLLERFESADSSEPRAIGDIRRDLKAFVKNSKQDDDLNLQIGAIVDLCQLHREIVFDPRFESNRPLQSLRAQAAHRLKEFRKQFEIQVKRRERELARAEKHRLQHDGNDEDPDSVPSSETIAQSSPSEETTTIDPLDVAMSASMFELTDAVGGPAEFLQHLPGNFAPPWDHGEELVDLIESTINPDSWKSQGGTGVIHYYRPLRILVVSASSQVHDDMTNLLRNLRRNSR